MLADSQGEYMAETDSQDNALRSLKYNVIGEPRKNRVPLPRGIKGGKPGAIPNTKVK